MSAAVDVLAVMAAAAQSLAICCPEADDARHNEMVAARAAVAELIEADTKFDAAFNAWMVNRHSQSLLDSLCDATDVRAAALARVQGGAA